MKLLLAKACIDEQPSQAEVRRLNPDFVRGHTEDRPMLNTILSPPQGCTVMFDGCPMVLDIDTLADLARVFTAQDALNTGDVNMCTALLTVHDHHRVRVSLGQRSERGG